jgi:hypothetical protein
MSKSKSESELGTALLVLVGGIFVILTTIFAIGALEAYILCDVSRLYNVPFIKELSFLQTFGLAVCVGILVSRLPQKTKEDDYSAWQQIALKIVYYLVIWGFAYLFFNLFA